MTKEISPSCAKLFSGNEVHKAIDAEGYRKYYKQCSLKEKTIFDNECQPLFECRTCGEIFRSLMFFISHKRTFCREILGINLQDSRKIGNREPSAGLRIGRPPKKERPKSKNPGAATGTNLSKDSGECKIQKSIGDFSGEVRAESNIPNQNDSDVQN